MTHLTPAAAGLRFGSEALTVRTGEPPVKIPLRRLPGTPSLALRPVPGSAPSAGRPWTS